MKKKGETKKESLFPDEVGRGDTSRLTEKFYQALLDVAQDVIFVINEKKRVLYVNDFAANLVGISKHELIGKRLDEIFPGDISERQSANLEKVFNSGKPVYSEYKVVLRKREIWQSTMLSPLKNEEGKIDAVMGISRDISGGKLVNNALRESEEILSQIIQQLPYPVEVCAADGRLLIANRAFLDLFGISSEDFVTGKYNLCKDPTIDKLGLREEVNKVLSGEPVYVPEIAVPHEYLDGEYDGKKRGTIFHEITMFPVLNQSGELHQIVLIWRDITERHNVSEELLIKAQLLDAATDSIFVHDLEGKFIYVNEAAYRLRGYSEEELMGMNLNELDSPEQLELIEPRLRELLEKGEATFESAHLRKDGSVMSMEVHSRVIEPTPRRKLILSVARDITERKRAREALLHKDREIRRAYVEVISAVTGGRLILMTDEEIEVALGEPVGALHSVSSAEGLALARIALEEDLEKGFPGLEARDNLVIATNEALTNSVKHSERGEFQVFKNDNVVQVIITDSGHGIDFTHLPKATLLAGYSTKQTLGVGFSIMLELCDRVMLSTQPGGTKVVLEVGA